MPDLYWLVIDTPSDAQYFCRLMRGVAMRADIGDINDAASLDVPDQYVVNMSSFLSFLRSAAVSLGSSFRIFS